MAKDTLKKQREDADTMLAVNYFYQEKIDAMKKAGFSEAEIANSSYVKHLKEFLAMDKDIVAKYKAEKDNSKFQSEERAKRVNYEKEVYAMDHDPKQAAIDYFVQETKDAMRKAGRSEDEIAKSSYVKNLSTFLAMDDNIVAKYQAEISNKELQNKERSERVKHEKEILASEKSGKDVAQNVGRDR